MTLSPGLHRGLPMAQYLALDAIGSGRLGWLAVSPRHYAHMILQPREETDATRIGTAVHVALLEPDLFLSTYALEPGPEVAPTAVKFRATNAYKSACAELERAGRIVLKVDEMADVLAMADSIRKHEVAAKLLERAPEREVTGLWDQDGRRCRLRADLLGDGILGDVKTTRSLARFSPWVISDEGYYRQAGLYSMGLERLGRPIRHVYFIAVENTAPFDVGVFALEPDALRIGQLEVEQLLARLDECERSGCWPGMFPEVATATISNQLLEQLEEVA